MVGSNNTGSNNTGSNNSALATRMTYSLLLIILVAGAMLRTWNVNFDQGTGSHPDERSTACFYAPSIQMPASWDEFWEPQQSRLNPLWDVNQQQRRSFTYGHFPLYVGIAVGELLHKAAPIAKTIGLPEANIAMMERANTPCNGIAVAGRLTIALFDTLTILLLFLLGRRIAGQGVGLIAAAFYAFTAQAVQLSHFFAMDPASTTFTVFTLWGAVMMVQRRSLAAVVLTGVGAGLAISSKFSALPILAVPITASILILLDERQRGIQANQPVNARAQLVATLGVVLAIFLAGLTFFITSPYAVLDWENFIQATLVEQGRMVRGIADMPFTRQYRNTIPYLYFIEQQVHWGLGLPLGIIAGVGTIYALVRLLGSLLRILFTLIMPARLRLTHPQMANILIWSWLVPYFGLTGAFLAKFNRYMSPVLPFVVLFAALLIGRIWQRSKGSMAQSGLLLFIPRTIAFLMLVIGLAGGLFWSTAYVNGVYNTEHTWLTASRWVYENAPEGSIILWESWDDALPKTVPNEPGMDMGSAGLRNIDWSPYEEDTIEKYETMKAKLREADFVSYSSKRIYDSVDELPERYPMTTLYYDSMWDGSLGFELALDQTTPPTLFGYTFDDRKADESWSLYDHPQVTIFRKVRDLSDAEYDAIFAGTWEDAKHWYRGEDSPISPILNRLGLGNSPESEDKGFINAILATVKGEKEPKEPPTEEEQAKLLIDRPLTELPVVDNYRWNREASEDPLQSVVWWWAILAILGWLAWPFAFWIFKPLRDRGYLLSRAFGWLIAGWLLWYLASIGVLQNTVTHAWYTVAALGTLGFIALLAQLREMGRFLRKNWGLLLASEILFAIAYLAFIYIRMKNPDIWQPWFGGEKFMEFAFLNGILRSPTFPPVDPHFAGGIINYYYFGLYLVAYLIKLTGIYAEVAFNLAIASLFALTAVNVFAIAYSAIKTQAPSHPSEEATRPWQWGFLPALFAPIFVIVIGNLDGLGQILRNLVRSSTSDFKSALPMVETLVHATSGLRHIIEEGQKLPDYNFWDPSRVIPYTINEFPYWSFLFADLHPHLIGIPFAGLFIALLLTLIYDHKTNWRRSWLRGIFLIVLFGLMLGTLASVNLWELPTYLGLGILAFMISQFRGHGRIHWPWTLLIIIAYGGAAYALFQPFFDTYTNVSASGVGLVREPDELGTWLLIWGFFMVILISWLIYAVSRPAYAHLSAKGRGDAESNSGAARDSGQIEKAAGIERLLSAAFRRFDRLPRLLYLHRLLVANPTLPYLIGAVLLPVLIFMAAALFYLDYRVLALCLIPMGLATLLLWRRGREVDAGTLLAALLAATGFAILAGTQVVYMKDFLGGGDWYRMNTLFKFFSQIWVLWGVAAAIALPRIWQGFIWRRREDSFDIAVEVKASPIKRIRWGRLALSASWTVVVALLLLSSFAYTIWGTPVRLDMRLVGWRPDFGTLNGLDYMRQGVYTWPDSNNSIELKHDWEAIQWLLDNVQGNAVIVETSEVDYYRAGSTRVASLTGLSGLRGMHEGEQRYSEQLGPRDGFHREFWSTPDIDRTTQLLTALEVSLIYVGQLEQHQHPNSMAKLTQMADMDLIIPLFQNERVTIYGVPDKLDQVGLNQIEEPE